VPRRTLSSEYSLMEGAFGVMRFSLLKTWEIRVIVVACTVPRGLTLRGERNERSDKTFGKIPSI